MLNQKNKKIVIATGTFPPEISGQATFVSNLIKELPSEIKTVVIAYGKKNESRKKNIFIIKRNFWRYFNYWWRLKNEAKDAEIIYAQDLVSSGLPAALAKRKNNKLIVRIGGDFLWEKMVNSGKCEVPFSQYYDQPKSLRENFYLAIYRFVFSKSDGIIFNSFWQKEIYLKFFKIKPEKIVVIENPLLIFADDNFQYQPNWERKEIIFAGRFIPLKNLKRLIKAFKNIKTDKKLVLIGAGPQKQELKELAEDDERIAIEPPMSREALWLRLKSAYLVVLPSLSEMNPNLALEAMALLRPVVLTKENGLQDEFKTGCKLIDPLSPESIKSAIEYFLDEKNYNDFSSKIKNSGVFNSWEDVISKHLEIFESL